MNIDRLKGSVPFPEAGEGVELMFLNSDTRTLQKVFGATWLTGAYERLNNMDSEFIFECVKVGCKDANGKRVNVDIDNITEPMSKIAEKVLDALFVSAHGQTFGDYVAEIDRKMKEAALKGESPLGEASSPESS